MAASVLVRHRALDRRTETIPPRGVVMRTEPARAAGANARAEAGLMSRTPRRLPKNTFSV